jgi:hypothetical protein
MHQRGEHDVRCLREVPLRRHLGSEIGEHCHRAQQPPEIFVGRCHSCERAIDPRAIREYHAAKLLLLWELLVSLVRQSALANMDRMKHCAAIFVFLLLLSIESLAWGPEGHRIVGDIAETRLTRTARLQVKELLGNGGLAAVSVWADEIKRERPETYGWHFVDTPMDGSGFFEQRDCFRPDEKHPYTLQDHHNCVVDRISMFKHVLADRNAPRQDRIEALKFLVHFVGDVHQPMHAIEEARGGNGIHISEFGSTQCGKYACNLHFAWDTGLIEHVGISEKRYVARLNELIASRKLTVQGGGTPAEWANESFLLAKKVWLNDGDAVDETYFENDIGIVNRRLALAGIRLARMINQLLGR